MPFDKKSEAKWWEGAKDHRFALEVLQLPLRRRMLSLMAAGLKSNEQVASELDLPVHLTEYHLQMLEKALVIEPTEGGWIVTPTGQLYLKHVEAGS